MESSFESLGLQPQFIQAVEVMGFTQPTPIQESAIPAMLAGKDVIGQAQTGTGKTAAFMLPVLQSLHPGHESIQALVLAPTRELARQVAEAGLQLAGDMPVRILAVYGGQSYTIQKRALERGVDVVVGTPGRLLDLISQKVLNLNRVHALVLDEADEMLEMGFIDDVESILKEIPQQRQISLFSATLPEAIRSLAKKYLVDPEKICLSPEKLTVEETRQLFCRVREENKFTALTRLIEMEPVTSALIFVRTKARAQDLADELARNGFSADSLHGDLNQARRELVLTRFRDHSVNLLVATDVAARGLDIAGVSHVFNYDVPQDGEDYVHRIGRTGRAGEKGVAITLLAPRERSRQGQIQAYTRQPVEEIALPTAAEIQVKRDEVFIEKLSGQLLAGMTPQERAMLERISQAGLKPAEITLAAIRLARAAEGKIAADVEPELPREPRHVYLESRRNNANGFHGKAANGSEPARSTGRKDRYDSHQRPERGREEGMIKLWMNVGQTAGLRPSDVVGAIATEVGIPGRAIGEIDIRSDYTLVDVAEQHARRVLNESTGKYKMRGRLVRMRLADQ
jgi:ATP-dependent RNA helicase DeaD